jgi:Leucine-rich repeat (LRR) protein
MATPTTTLARRPGRRRWLQFSLRSLLALTALCGAAMGWLAWEWQFYRRQAEAASGLRDAGAWVDTRPVGSAWLRKLCGEDLLQDVVGLNCSGMDLGDADLRRLALLTELETLSLNHASITDPGFECFRHLRKLRELRLRQTAITDDGLANVAQFKQLETLNLSFTDIGDAGARHLNGLTKLRSLHLDGTRITDAGVENLKTLKNLEWLNLYRTTVSDSGMVHLRPLTKLKWLDLSRTRVSDAALRELTPLMYLERLLLVNTAITDAGLKDFQKARPDVWTPH